MQRVDMKADVRTGAGKGVARKLRAVGQIPGVLYGGDRSPISIRLGRRDLSLILQSHEGRHLLVNLAVEGDGGENTLAFLQDLAINPVTNRIDHADFRRVDATKPIRTTIPVHFTGQPAGVRVGGVLQYVLRDVEIEALPNDIPENIEANIAHLGLGQTLHVSDLSGESRPYTVLTPPDRVLANVATPRLVAETEGTPAAGAEAAPGEAGPADTKAG
jgi:large subunit ribosomal protein L25